MHSKVALHFIFRFLQLRNVLIEKIHLKPYDKRFTLTKFINLLSFF